MRRRSGAGTIAHIRSRGYWLARVTLASGRRVARKRSSEADAEAALLALKTEYAGELGYHYRLPRPYHHGTLERPTRVGISPHVRFTVLERDGFRCRYCGAAAASGAVLQVDHVIALADGGTDDLSNLATACKPCNLGKGGRSVRVPGP